MAEKDKDNLEKAFTALLDSFRAMPQKEMRLRDVKKFAEILVKMIKEDSKRLKNSVAIGHKDGSTMLLRHAFIEKIGSFVMVFTKNQGTWCYDTEDLTAFMEMIEVS